MASKKKKTGAPRGRKSNFKDSRHELLKSLLPKYFAAVKSKKVAQFWTVLNRDYWKAFPWNLPLDTEPTEDTVYIEPTTPEQKAEKAKILAKTNMSLKNWFRHRWNADTKNRNSPWETLLQGLRAENVAPPRKLPAWKLFMREHNKEVLKKYDEENPNKTPIQRSRDLKTRCAIARKLYDALTAEEKTTYNNMAIKQYDDEMADFTQKREAVSGNKVPTYAQQVEARELAAATLSPLLGLISRYTGCCVSLLLGAPPNTGEKLFHLQAIHSGTTTATNQTWSEYDRDGFQTAMKHFSAFLAKTDRKYGTLTRVHPRSHMLAAASKDLGDGDDDNDNEDGDEDDEDDEDDDDDDEDDDDGDLDGNQPDSSESEEDEEEEAESAPSRKRKRNTRQQAASPPRTRGKGKEAAAPSSRTQNKRKKPAGRGKGKKPAGRSSGASAPQSPPSMDVSQTTNDSPDSVAEGEGT
ncbi:hypothetical protein EIP86_007018 [Pleurotus ostreatoroseus]|nr:hypothetical protein EIP86_007018 [Pleurotus ostreatoroseus]